MHSIKCSACRSLGSWTQMQWPFATSAVTDQSRTPQAVLAAHVLQGQDLAVMTVGSKWAPNKPKEAKHCYGTTSIEHPGVSMISMERGKYYLGE